MSLPILSLIWLLTGYSKRSYRSLLFLAIPISETACHILESSSLISAILENKGRYTAESRIPKPRGWRSSKTPETTGSHDGGASVDPFPALNATPYLSMYTGWSLPFTLAITAATA